MPRKARILVSNYPHHIVQRGHNRNAVFLADEDYPEVGPVKNGRIIVTSPFFNLGHYTKENKWMK